MTEKRIFTQEEQQQMYRMIWELSLPDLSDPTFRDAHLIVLAKVANENARALLATFDPPPDHLPKVDAAAGEGES